MTWRGLSAVAAAGAVAGIAAGLKLSGAPWAFAVAVAFFFIAGPLARRWCLALFAALGVTAGVLLSYGWWAIEMWSRYGNPIMPSYNQFFKSSYAPAAPFTDLRFVPHGIVEIVLYPFIWTFNPLRTAEISFRELSLPIVEVLLLAILARGLVRMALWRRWVPFFSSDRLRYVVGWTVIGYLAWAVEFGIYRYLIPLEALSFVLMFALLRELVGVRLPRKAVVYAFVVLAAFCVVTEVPGNWGRVEFGSRYFTATVTPDLQQKAAFLIVGVVPIGYVIPLLPHDSFFTHVGGGLLATPVVHSQIADHLSQYGAVYTIWASDGPPPTAST